MSILQNQLKEYDHLRNEINQKIELHNKLITFTITTVVAILSFALSKDIPLLFLMPLIIILPMSMRIAYYRIAMSKLSAYIIVFFEDHIDGLNWESRNTILINNSIANLSQTIKNHKTPCILPYYECLVLSIICYVLYLISYIKEKPLQIITMINIIWPLILIVIECIITYQINSADKKKTEWINRWRAIKSKELE